MIDSAKSSRTTAAVACSRRAGITPGSNTSSREGRMARVTWPVLNDRPCVQIDVMLGGRPTTINLHADTGAGAASSAFDLLLLESDCWLVGKPTGTVAE